MKCTIKGCPGHYSRTLITHTIKQGNELFVFEDVPAEVCDCCSDVLLAPDTIRHMERLIDERPEPRKHAPVYAYA